MKLLVLTAIALTLLSGCQECPGGTFLTVKETQTPSKEPAVLEPADVEEEAPVVYRLLEDSYATGTSKTTKQSEMDAVDDYLARQPGATHPYLVQYRGKYFSFLEAGC